jgi:hypothetical protein
MYSSFAPHAGWHGARITADPDHQDRTVFQEALFRPIVGPGDGESWLTIGHCSPATIQPVELHFHDFRGTAVTLLSEATAPRSKSQPLPAIRLRRCTVSLSDTLRAHAV